MKRRLAAVCTAESYMNNTTNGKTLFAVSSITYAVKAQELLRSSGFSAEVVKTPKELAKGCGYSVRVSGDAKRAEELIQEAGIAIKGKIRL